MFFLYVANLSKALPIIFESRSNLAASASERVIFLPLEHQIQDAATRLDFEKAITLREQWHALKQQIEK
ncbi:MAG TPA: hypothetical protein ENI08_03235 [Candidatus Dependentiae bacterium]|nr:hypothetical protein [Candidatus Dependentiae bacterium]